MEKSVKSFTYALLAVLFWSTIPTAFKTALAEAEIIPILTIASVTSALVLLIIVAATGKLRMVKQTSRNDLLRSAMLGFINPFTYYLILLKAYQLLPGQVAQPLNMIWPIVLVFLSVPLLKQKIPAGSYISLFISFVGVYIISSQGKPLSPGESDLTGVMLATGSSFFWALYFILNIRDRRDQSVKLLVNFCFASVYLVILSVATGQLTPPVTIKGVSAAIYIGIFEMGLTFYLWLKAMQLATTNDKIGNLVYLSPFLSLILLNIFIGEPVYITTPIGLLFIIAGILYQNRKSLRKRVK